MKHSNILEEVVAAEFEPPEFHPEVGNKLPLTFKRRDLSALFSIYGKQQRGQSVTEAYDAARRLTVKHRYARSVAGAGTMPHGSAASLHNAPEKANARFGKRSRTVGATPTSGCAWHASRKQRDCPQRKQGK